MTKLLQGKVCLVTGDKTCTTACAHAASSQITQPLSLTVQEEAEALAG